MNVEDNGVILKTESGFLMVMILWYSKSLYTGSMSGLFKQKAQLMLVPHVALWTWPLQELL